MEKVKILRHLTCEKLDRCLFLLLILQSICIIHTKEAVGRGDLATYLRIFVYIQLLNMSRLLVVGIYIHWIAPIE